MVPIDTLEQIDIPEEAQTCNELFVLHAFAYDEHRFHLVNTEQVTGFHSCCSRSLRIKLVYFVLCQILDHMLRYLYLALKDTVPSILKLDLVLKVIVRLVLEAC